MKFPNRLVRGGWIFFFVAPTVHALSSSSPTPPPPSSARITNPLQQWGHDLRIEYSKRVTADPSFPKKSLTELVLAASTQLAAEMERRGPQSLLPQFDFVLAGVLTAVFGKYYSMWRVAPTQETATQSPTRDATLIGTNLSVPNNAFQRFLLDGVTRPTALQRLGSLLAPMLSLFRAGFLASAVGYGLVRLLIAGRSMVFPNFTAQTQNVNVLLASLYTGGFMAVVSNLRYQILQGLIEPFLQRLLQGVPVLAGATIFAVRIGNGILGSILAIAGMRHFGLQAVK